MSITKENHIRNQKGMTLPFALMLTFIFSALVAVSYLFVSVNVQQMQSNLLALQAIGVAEGINERVKARLNTKSKIQPSLEQEEKLKTYEGTDEGQEEELKDEEAAFDDDFDEETETFDEYYADEVIKISRFITFREPPLKEEEEAQESLDPALTQEEPSLRPEANVERIGDIEIPRGTILNKGIMIIVFKDEKLNLKLKDITSPQTAYLPKLPAPFIKSLIPNYSESNTRSRFVVNGENLPKTPPAFSNKDIVIEDIRGGPQVDFLIGKNIMPGLTRFYWGTASCEFYVIPPYDGSPRPIINAVKTSEGNELLEVKAGKSLTIKISGIDLFLKKSPSVAIPDTAGIITRVKSQEEGGRELTVNLNINKNTEPGTHSIAIATEGGLSNFWLFNILPSSELEGELGTNTATFTSGLTLLDIRVVENLLPLIDEEEELADEEDKGVKKGTKKTNAGKGPDDDDDDDLADIQDEGEIPESKKLSPFANTDLETTWLLETSCMIGKITKTVTEVIHREIPNIHGALITNGEITFDGGGYQIIGASTAMAILSEPTYLSNTVLNLVNPQLEQTQQEVKDTSQKETQQPQVTKTEFTPGSFIAVYKAGERIGELDYGILKDAGIDTLELFPPGLMDFHYEGDDAFQFIPPVISKEKISQEEAERHLAPKEFIISIPNAANFRNIFKSTLEQFSELADLYTNEPTVPIDEYGIPLGYMGLSYVEGTAIYDTGNPLSGKGLLIIDTRADNLGSPQGTIEFNGTSKSPIDFTGIVYVRGNVRIGGNVNINGALIVDNDERGNIQVASDALGRIAFDTRAIKQTLIYLPFSTKPGTVMISNKQIDVGDAIQTGTQVAQKLGASATFEAPQTQVTEGTVQPQGAEETLLETKKPPPETIRVQPQGSNAEKELIELF